MTLATLLLLKELLGAPFLLVERVSVPTTTCFLAEFVVALPTSLLTLFAEFPSAWLLPREPTAIFDMPLPSPPAFDEKGSAESASPVTTKAPAPATEDDASEIPKIPVRPILPLTGPNKLQSSPEAIEEPEEDEDAAAPNGLELAAPAAAKILTPATEDDDAELPNIPGPPALPLPSPPAEIEEPDDAAAPNGLESILLAIVKMLTPAPDDGAAMLPNIPVPPSLPVVDPNNPPS